MNSMPDILHLIETTANPDIANFLNTLCCSSLNVVPNQLIAYI